MVAHEVCDCAEKPFCQRYCEPCRRNMKLYGHFDGPRIRFVQMTHQNGIMSSAILTVRPSLQKVSSKAEHQCFCRLHSF